MALFNMQEFNEILEKCKDQSQQQKQDQVSQKWFCEDDFLINSCVLNANLEWITEWPMRFDLFLDASSAVRLHSADPWEAGSL